MNKDTLFLLKPGFYDGDQGPYVCAECAKVEGYLALYPHVAMALDVRHIAFRRPRAEIVALLGEANQGCPVLVLADGAKPAAGAPVKAGIDRRYIDDPNAILSYLGSAYRAPVPH
jgi:hypothetical protein